MAGCPMGGLRRNTSEAVCPPTTCASSCAKTCDGSGDRPEPSQICEPWVNACACISSLSCTASGPDSGCPAGPPERIRDSVSELTSEPWAREPAEAACRCTPPEQPVPLAQPE